MQIVSRFRSEISKITEEQPLHPSHGPQQHHSNTSPAVVHPPQMSHMVQDIGHVHARIQFLQIKPVPFIDSSYLLKIKTHQHEITDSYSFEIGWGLEHFKILSLWLKLVSTGTLSQLHGTITLQYLNPCSYTRITSSSMWSFLFQNKDGVSFFFYFNYFQLHEINKQTNRGIQVTVPRHGTRSASLPWFLCTLASTWTLLLYRQALCYCCIAVFPQLLEENPAQELRPCCVHTAGAPCLLLRVFYPLSSPPHITKCLIPEAVPSELQ